MASRFTGHLLFGGGSTGTALPVGRFDVQESYDRGWTIRVAVFAPGSTHMSIGSMVGNALAAGIVPGRAVVLQLGMTDEGGESDSVEALRAWPGIVSGIEPLDPGQSRAQVYCLVTIVDILSYLSRQKVWGAYRAAPAAEIVGGVISLAAGTAGKPTTDPVVPIHGNIGIVSRLRESMDWLPYAIVAGKPLRPWLDSFCGLLGIRMEMLGNADGSLSIVLADSVPRDDPMTMTLPADETVGHSEADGDEDSEDAGGEADHGELSVLNLSARRGKYRRAVLLDDPTQGQLRLMGSGPVGTVITGVQVSIDEAYSRAEQDLIATAAQLLVLTGESRQPGLRPGRRVILNRAIRGIGAWQFHTVVHSLRGKTYSNRALMLNGKFAWHPERPIRAAPVVVPAVVDGGPKFLSQEPVPRDRLGRIPVSFPFTPMPSEESEEERKIMEHDSNRDGLLTAEDFALELQQMSLVGIDPLDTENSSSIFLLDTESRENDVESLRNGDFNDPHPGISDEDLDDEQLAERRRREEQQTGTYRYLAWKRFLERKRGEGEYEGDYDGDQYVTMRDEAMSDELREEFEEDGGKRLRELSRQAELRRRGEEGYEGDWETGYEDATPEDRQLIEEWEQLFGDRLADSWESHVARLDADAAAQKWPPRIPLSIVQPMAGSLHGFVSGHRQGDACRVAVHDPLWAEIVGFEYRRHRAIGPGLHGATAGVVVEHDNQSAWSGLLFRRNEEEQNEE